jgi:hypothetical protein
VPSTALVMFVRPWVILPSLKLIIGEDSIPATGEIYEHVGFGVDEFSVLYDWTTAHV